MKVCMKLRRVVIVFPLLSGHRIKASVSLNVIRLGVAPAPLKNKYCERH